MRIALVYDAVYPWVRGGGEAHLDELAGRLLARGHQVHRVGMKWWEGPSRIEREGLVLHGVAPPWKLYGPTGRRRVAPPLAFGLGATAWLLGRHFDVVDVCAFPYFAALGAQLALARRAWTTTWFEVWGDYWRQYLGPIGRAGQRIERQAARGCRFHIAHSPLTAGRLRALCPDATVRMIPSGIEASRPDPAPPREARRIAWCGRAIQSKNLPLLLHALALSADRDWSLDIVGDGPCLDAWKAEAARLGLGERVHWQGFVQGRAELHRILARAGIFVQTSRREGMGKSALEAAGLGCALVCLEHPEVATTGFLEDGRSALFFGGDSDPKSPQQLAPILTRTLANLLGNAAEQRRIAEGGQVVAANLAWDRVVERVLAHYDQVAGA